MESSSLWAYLAVFALMVLAFAGIPAIGAAVVAWASVLASQETQHRRGPGRGAGRGGHPAPETKQWLSAGLVFGAAIAVLTALGRAGPPARRAAVFAAAAALCWALEATFLKAATNTLAAFGIAGMLIRWPVYALIAAGVVMLTWTAPQDLTPPQPAGP